MSLAFNSAFRIVDVVVVALVFAVFL